MTAADVTALCGRIRRDSATVLDNITPIAATVHGAEGGLTGLPPVVRGLISSAVSREVARNTGQGIPAWVETLADLTAALRGVQDAVGRIEAGGAGAEDRALLAKAAARVEEAEPLFERLATFMERAPAKVRRVPTTIVPAPRRDAFLATLADQARAIRRALEAMPELSEALRALEG